MRTHWFGTFFQIFCNEKNPCLIRVLACFGYFVVAFCPYMPIGIYGQRKSSTFCVLLSNTRADVAKGLYPYTLRGKF
jgi:hypothetical protein